MILEVAVLNVRDGLQNKFEQDFALAGQYISSIKGYRGHTLRKSIETKNRYILLVDWVDIKSHEIGFRKSQVYKKWKELLHGYYAPFPKVEHDETIFENKKNNN